MSRRLGLPLAAVLLGILLFGVALFLIAPMAPPATAAAEETLAAASTRRLRAYLPWGKRGLSSQGQKSPAQTRTAALTLPSAAGTSAAGVSGAPIVPPGMTLHVAQRGQSVASLVHTYLPQTRYMTGSELDRAIRAANLGLKGNGLKPGESVLIPGYESEWHEQPISVNKDFEVRAIYLTGTMAGSARGLELVRQWRELGGNAVVFDVKDSDGLMNVPFEHSLLHAPAQYQGESPMANRTVPPIRNLPKYVRWLHSQNMHAIARIAIFRDEYLVTHHPELAVRSRSKSGQPWRENGKLVWADPSHPAVHEYNIALANYAAAAGVDEVQFDYVRFPAEGDQKDAQFAFEKAHPGWQRSEAISDFLSQAHSELRKRNVLFSLDVFGVMAWQRSIDLAHTGQDIPQMARRCDVLSPMIYPSHFFGMDGYKDPGDAPEHFIGASMEKFRQITQDSGVILRPWLQAFAWRTHIYSPDYILRQVTAAKEKGGVGFLFWNARNDYAKPFTAMTAMRGKPGQYFRGDELPTHKVALAQAATPGRPERSGD